MDFGKRKVRGRRGNVKIEMEDMERKYEHTLTFYIQPPDDSISLQEFEDYAVARLKLLRVIERVNLMSNVKYSQEWVQGIQKELKQPGSGLEHFSFPILPINGDSTKLLEARKFDHLSHYILRLAYCRSEESRKWMISLEVDYFRFKYARESKHASERFMESHNMSYNPMNKTEQKDILDKLQCSNFQISAGTIADIDYYEVPFIEVLDLVRARKVFLRKGIAFVPYTELGQLLASKLRSSLSQSLAVTSKLIKQIEDDERIYQLLQDFDKRHTGRSFGEKKDKENTVSVDMLPELSQKSFPLCMKNLYEVVKKESHVKHWGRLQLGLFFKGLGLPLDDSINFWRTNFMKKAGMDGTRFDKQYLYNIRHMYGKEGKRADYTPHSCMKIIMSSVGPGESHGCPFRHSDPIPLRAKLADANISAPGIKEIIELAEKTHYSIACQKYFEWVHNKATVDGGINHPNQYFEESRKVLLGVVRTKASDLVKKTKVNVYSESEEPTVRNLTEEIKDWPNEDEDMEDFIMNEIKDTDMNE